MEIDPEALMVSASDLDAAGSPIRLVLKCINLGSCPNPGVIRETDSPGVVERVRVYIILYTLLQTSNQAGLPAELKHINKRRKRN